MLRNVASTILTAWMLLAAVLEAGERPHIIWHDDYETASAEAQILERPLLLYFTGQWCPSCLRLDRTSFIDKRIVGFITARLVAVRIDADTSPELAENWKVDRLPTVLLLRQDGQEQGRIEGYRSAGNYLSELETLAGSAQQATSRGEPPWNAQPALRVASVQTSPEIPSDERIELATRSVKSAANGSVGIQLSLEPEPKLAFDGVCVVTMLEQHKIVKGEPGFCLDFDGMTYWFSGMPELERFQANPARYTPLRSGYCMVSLTDDACAVPGSMRCAAVYRDRLYLFAGPEQRRRFQTNPKRYADIASDTPAR